jgi:hypothetical protein
MVTRRRGGYCYEHHSLYAAASERLGFTVRRLAARSLAVGGAEVGPRTHMTSSPAWRNSQKPGLESCNQPAGASAPLPFTPKGPVFLVR